MGISMRIGAIVWATVVLMCVGSQAMAGLEIPAGAEGIYNVKTYGAKADGKTDDTAAIQSALNAAGARKCGVVYLPPGQYLVKGVLNVPNGVAVAGRNQSPQAIHGLTGTVILAAGGRDSEDAALALFKMTHATAVRGLTVFYPDQNCWDIHPYPWTFYIFGEDCTIENITLINSYNGIRIGPEPNVRHRIIGVHGCVLRRGIFVDGCTDIGRIEDVHWHCHYWSSLNLNSTWGPVDNFMLANLEAFIFGRTDWEFVTNTFTYPAKIGYHFIATPRGSFNGQLSGIAADATENAVVVDSLQGTTTITNGQFVAFRGSNPISVVVNNTGANSFRLVNCAFWGPGVQNVVSKGGGFVSLSDCHFNGGAKPTDGKAQVEAIDGRIQVRGCTFWPEDSKQPSVMIRKGVTHAIVTENNGRYGVNVQVEEGVDAVVGGNEPAK